MRAATGVRQRPQRPLSAADPRTPTRKRQGLSRLQVDAAIVRQAGLCPLCDLPLGDDYVVDHCHACAETHGHSPSVGCPACFRAVTHRSCNTALGWFEKRPGRVTAYSRHGRH